MKWKEKSPNKALIMDLGDAKGDAKIDAFDLHCWFKRLFQVLISAD